MRFSASAAKTVGSIEKVFDVMQTTRDPHRRGALHAPKCRVPRLRLPMVIDGGVASMGAIAGVGRSLGGVASRGRMQYAPPVNMARALQDSNL